MSQLVKEMQKVIRDCGKSRYAISQETGVDEGQLSRFMSKGYGISLETLELIADCIGYEITARPKRRRKGR